METHVWNKADLALASGHIVAWTVFWRLYEFVVLGGIEVEFPTRLIIDY